MLGKETEKKPEKWSRGYLLHLNPNSEYRVVAGSPGFLGRKKEEIFRQLDEMHGDWGIVWWNPIDRRLVSFAHIFKMFADSYQAFLAANPEILAELLKYPYAYDIDPIDPELQYTPLINRPNKDNEIHAAAINLARLLLGHQGEVGVPIQVRGKKNHLGVLSPGEVPQTWFTLDQLAMAGDQLREQLGEKEPCVGEVQLPRWVKPGSIEQAFQLLKRIVILRRK
jgi:hypothetical protein